MVYRYINEIVWEKYCFRIRQGPVISYFPYHHAVKIGKFYYKLKSWLHLHYDVKCIVLNLYSQESEHFFKKSLKQSLLHHFIIFSQLCQHISWQDLKDSELNFVELKVFGATAYFSQFEGISKIIFGGTFLRYFITAPFYLSKTLSIKKSHL